jgi:hypothetical protein
MNCPRRFRSAVSDDPEISRCTKHSALFGARGSSSGVESPSFNCIRCCKLKKLGISTTKQLEKEAGAKMTEASEAVEKERNIRDFYKLGRILGQGTFANVKLSTKISDNTKWAVKEIGTPSCILLFSTRAFFSAFLLLSILLFCAFLSTVLSILLPFLLLSALLFSLFSLLSSLFSLFWIALFSRLSSLFQKI